LVTGGRVQMSGRIFDFPSDRVGELRQSNDVLADVAALRDRLNGDGYLMIRDFIDREAVLATRRSITAELAQRGCLLPGSDPMAALLGPEGPGSPPIDATQSYILELFGRPTHLQFFERLYAQPAMLYPKILVRIKATGGKTGIHCDNVYIGHGSPQVLTCWTPLGDIAVEQGPLALCAGSHDDPRFERLRVTYGHHDPDRDAIKGADNAAGHFSWDLDDVTESFGGRWLTANFRAGDVLIFPALMLHCGLENSTDAYRISADSRFQPAADPVDRRFMNEEEDAALLRYRDGVREGKIESITMEQARAQWRV
jgi:ectoine hydroxylase-related dioxygenase (phytanoyl-CoA dioxygenase family)